MPAHEAGADDADPDALCAAAAHWSRSPVLRRASLILDECLVIDRELIAGTRVGDLACTHLVGGCLGVNARLAEADDRVGSSVNDAHFERSSTGRRSAATGSAVVAVNRRSSL